MGASRTLIAVDKDRDRHRVSLSTGLLRPQLVHGRPGWCRIGLVATTALLLGGDAVEVEARLGPGAHLDLFDVAGTVAFNGRGCGASWTVRVHLAEGAVLRLSGEPFVVADGADVTRSLQVDLASSASALLRETVILGRTGEQGGRLRNLTAIDVGGQPVCLEDQELDPATYRALPGMLGDLRILDTITAIGRPPPPVDPCGLPQFTLVSQAGTITRYLGHQLAPSPLHREWTRLLDTDLS